MNDNTKRVTFNKITTGLFDVLFDGTKTGYEIYNGSLGASGRGANMYIIVNETKGTRKPIGSLQMAKRWAAMWALKANGLTERG